VKETYDHFREGNSWRLGISFVKYGMSCINISKVLGTEAGRSWRYRPNLLDGSAADSEAAEGSKNLKIADSTDPKVRFTRQHSALSFAKCATTQRDA
jgi:hypothetical protein